MSDLEKIDLALRGLYREMNVQASFGNPEDVNRVRDQIAELERQKLNLKSERSELCPNN